ncbi:MAG TPA: hypothetical protein V6D17_17065 [Candidatus Obscuribacterales bacterium]
MNHHEQQPQITIFCILASLSLTAIGCMLCNDIPPSVWTGVVVGLWLNQRLSEGVKGASSRRWKERNMDCFAKRRREQNRFVSEIALM